MSKGIVKFKKAKDYIKYLDEQSGTSWSDDNELLADAMEDYAKMYHEQQVKNCSILDVSESFSKSDLLDLGNWFDGSPEFVEEVVNDWLNAR